MPTNNKLYAHYTETLHDVLIDNPNFLDNIFVFDNSYRAEKFKKIFISIYDIYEIGSETLELFKINLINTFKQYKDYYIELLNIYENNLFTINDLITNTKVIENVDLPNYVTTKEYLTSKTKETYTDKELLLNKRNELLNSIRLIYNEFAYQFKECFCEIFYTFKAYTNRGDLF